MSLEKPRSDQKQSAATAGAADHTGNVGSVFVFPPMKTRLLVVVGVIFALLGQIGLILTGSAPRPSTLAVFALGVGAVLFAFGMRGQTTIPHKWSIKGWIDFPLAVFGFKRNFLAVAFGTAALLILLFRLAQGSTSGWDIALWVVGIAALFVPFISLMQTPQADLLRRSRWDIVIITSLMIFFLALNVPDLTDWYYSAIGDEYAFYKAARNIIDIGLERPFNQDGVYGKFPVLSSAYQSLVMSIFGQDNFGWKMSSVLSILVAIPGVYVLTSALANRKVAIVSAILFSQSHYLFAYAHTGYNTIHPIPLSVWSLAFFVLGLTRRNPLALFVGGLIAGLGFYTHFAARTIVPIILLFVLAEINLRKYLKMLWPFGLGFGITVAPIFVISKGELLSRMLSEVPGGYSEAITGNPFERIITNTFINLIAFNYNSDAYHYVSGSLLDPVTAILAILGVGLALAKLRNPSYRLLAIWALVGVTATGILSPYPEVAISRLNYVIPPLIILAGLAAINIWDFVSLPISSRKRRWVGIVIVAMLSVIVLVLNIERFWFDTPKIVRLTQEAIAIGAMRSEECGGDPENIIIIGRDTEPLLRPALISYLSEDKLPRLIDHDDLESGVNLQISTIRCVIFAHPEDENAQQAIQYLRQTYPGNRTIKFSDPSRKGSVLIFEIGL